MENFRYIMVTNFDNHWDNIPDNQTYYKISMLREGMSSDKIRENTQTIFIKRNRETREIEKMWEGKVYGFNLKGDRIVFKVRIDKKISILPQYRNYVEGWYVEEEFDAICPPFFSDLLKTSNWDDFQKYTFYLLKLLGIHEIYKWEKQKGTADGFFQFKNLVVMYDSTLESNFEGSKETQINNYCAQLEFGSIKYQENVIKFHNCQKQVWVITRGTSRIIKRVSGVIVKEVSVNKLIQIYKERLENNLHEDQLENKLRDIERE